MHAAEMVFTDSIAQSRDALVLVWKKVENAEILRHICGGRVCSLDNYLDWIAGAKRSPHLPSNIIDALIRDVLPLPSYATLDDMAGAILLMRTTIADVLSVEPRQHEPPLWSDYVPGAGLWWTTIWCRINLAKALAPPLAAAKLALFIAAHKPCTDYLDSLPNRGLDDQAVDHRHLIALYAGAGPSLFDEDRSLIKMHRLKLQAKPTPLQLIQPAFPLDIWVIEEMVRALEKGTATVPPPVWDALEPAIRQSAGAHKLYISAQCICHQCQTYCEGAPLPLQDALYTYYLAFLDLFMLPRFDDEYLLTECVFAGIITPFQQAYPVDTRAFLADDLPNLYHVLMGIPFYGQQSDPPFLIAKYFQKCQPYSGQRRSLLTLTMEEWPTNEPFCILFRQIMWCMLANTYPGQPHTLRNFDWAYLKRCRQLTGSNDAMLAAFRDSGDTKGCLIILTAFRLYMRHMMESNEQMLKIARHFISDFDKVYTLAAEMGQTIRTSNLLPDDAFARARMLLARTKKSAAAKVNRYKTFSCAGTLLHCFNTELENEIFWVLNKFRQHCAELASCPLEQVGAKFGPHCKTVFRGKFFLAEPITPAEVEAALAHGRGMCAALDTGPQEVEHKQAILNVLLRMPEADRLAAKGLSLLRLPEFGGVPEEDIAIVMNMVAIYYAERPMPKDYELQMEKISDAAHFKLITYYLNVCVLLEKIRLVPLDCDTVHGIQRAMQTVRHPHMHLDASIYDVYLSLCCKSLKTLQGCHKYGHQLMAYNTSMQCFVCSKNDKKSAPKKRAIKREADRLEEEELQPEEDDEDEDEILDVEKIIEHEMGVDAAPPVGHDIRCQRKDFHFIPCTRQPLLRINLLGYALQYANHRYSHCITCAGLFAQRAHQFGKQCKQCAADTTEHCFSCAYCSLPVADALARTKVLTVRCSLRDQADAAFSPLARNDPFTQTLYFCEQHYYIAKQQVHNMDKPELFAFIRRTAERQHRAGANRVF